MAHFFPRGLSLVAAVVVAVVALSSTTFAADRPEEIHVDLLTVGPGSDLFMLWGHAALCVTTGELVDGTCLDFGVATESDPARLALGTLRGEALFRVIETPSREFLARNQWRDVWVQSLLLDRESETRFLALHRELLRKREAYAYEPTGDNCATRLRDLINGIVGGRLHEGSAKIAGPSRRQFAEEALSGRGLPLFLLALSGSAELDKGTTAWERMAFPAGLREGVRSRLGSAPVRLHSRVDTPPPTSRHLGKILLVFSGILSAALLLWGQRRGVFLERSTRFLLGIWLGALALVPLVGAASALPSLAASPLALLLWPTDFLLGFLEAAWLRRYLALRLGVMSLGVLVALLGCAPPTLLPVAFAAGLPLLALLRAEHRRGKLAGRASSS